MFDVGALWRQVMASLAALPDDDRDEIVASLVAGTVTDGEVAVALAGFLAGRDPRPDLTDPRLSEVLLGTLDDQETDRCTTQADALRVDPGPGAAAALAELAATAGPGGDLPAGLSDEQVLAFIQAAEQQARWAHALRCTGLRELATRWTTRNPIHDTDAGTDADAGRQRRLRKIEKREERTNPVRRAASGPRTPTAAEAMAAEDEAWDRGLLPLTFLGEAFTVAEAALATGVTETTAREWLTTARTLTQLPITTEALATGRLDWAKARTVADRLGDRTSSIRTQVEQRVVPRALTGPGQSIYSVTALRRALDAALLALDPPDPDEVDAERDTRRVWFRQLTPTIGELGAELPMEHLAMIRARLDAAVAQAHADRDLRTADQVRADTLTDLLLYGVLPRTGRTTGSVPEHVQVHVDVAMTLHTLLGLQDDPAYLTHYGPITADLARHLARHATFRCAIIDDEHRTVLGLGKPTFRTGYTPGARLQELMRTTWQTCTFPGCSTRVTAHTPARSDLDHADPWPHGATCSCNCHPLCRRHHNLKTHGKLVLEPSTDPADPPGTWRWRLPTGRHYTSRPQPLTPDTTHAIKTRPATTTPRQPAHDEDDPPPY